jgi:hypothetical protein
MEPGESDLPAAPVPPPASPRLTSPVKVAAASLSGVASASCIPSARIEASSPWRRPHEIVVDVGAPS